MKVGLARVDQWLLAAAPAERLAGLRIAVGGFVLVYMVANVGEVDRLANQPLTGFEPIGLASLLDQPLAAAMLWILYALQLVAGVGFVAGKWFRATGPAFAGLTLLWASYHSSFGQLLHFEHLFTLHLLVLAFAPAAATWSADASRSRAMPPTSDTAFGWPIRLLAICTVTTYFLAGVAKLRISGLSWIDGSTLENHIAYSATRSDLLGGFEPPLASFVISQSWALGPMAVAALAVELSAPLALVSSRFRNAWFISALLFHIGTAATMMVWFPYNGLGFAMLPLFHIERLVTRVGERATPHWLARRSVRARPAG